MLKRAEGEQVEGIAGRRGDKGSDSCKEGVDVE